MRDKFAHNSPPNVIIERKIHFLKKIINRYFQENERPLFELRESVGMILGTFADCKPEPLS
jgi:hypothetical protein